MCRRVETTARITSEAARLWAEPGLEIIFVRKVEKLLQTKITLSTASFQ
jgi:hypothetical protein